MAKALLLIKCVIISLGDIITEVVHYGSNELYRVAYFTILQLVPQCNGLSELTSASCMHALQFPALLNRRQHG